MLRVGLSFRATMEGRSRSDMTCSEEASRNPASGTTNYLYDGPNAVEEVDNNGSIVAQYAHGAGVDTPLAESRSGVTSYYDQDGLGSVSSLTNSAASLANTYTYNSFGLTTASTGALANPFRYTGREFDSETGFYYYRARYYDPTVGRFLSEDPIHFGGGADFYAYVFNSPLSLIDPFGLCGKCQQGENGSGTTVTENPDHTFTLVRTDSISSSTSENGSTTISRYDMVTTVTANSLGDFTSATQQVQNPVTIVVNETTGATRYARQLDGPVQSVGENEAGKAFGGALAETNPVVIAIETAQGKIDLCFTTIELADRARRQRRIADMERGLGRQDYVDAVHAAVEAWQHIIE